MTSTNQLELYIKGDNVIYFDTFWVENIPQEIEKFIEHKSITTNIYRMQLCDSIMSRYFFIGFIDFMSKGKSLTDYTNSFAPNKYEKNDIIILK